MVNRVKFIFLLINFTFSYYAQNIDSLKKCLLAAKHDSVRIKVLFDLAENAAEGEWQNYNSQMKLMAEQNLKYKTQSPSRNFYLKYLSASLNNIGYNYNSKGDINKALNYYNQSLKITEEIGNKQILFELLNNIGYIYENQGNLKKSLENYLYCLRTLEELLLKEPSKENKRAYAETLNNVGMIYYANKDFIKAEEYYNKSLTYRLEIGDKKGEAYSYQNIGSIYIYKKNFLKALEYFKKAYDIRLKINDEYGLSAIYYSIGTAYYNLNKIDSSLKYYLEGLKVNNKLGYQHGVSNVLNPIAEIYLELGNIAKATEYVNESFTINRNLGFVEGTMRDAHLLYKINKAKGNTAESLKMFELYTKMKDSLDNEGNKKNNLKQFFQFEYDKKALADSVKQAEAQLITDMKLKQEENLRYGLFIGLFLVIVFAWFMYNRFTITKKQNIIIEQQKHLVEEKNKEITDSINYAQRIQQTLMASKSLLNANLPDHMVLFKPKDIVSGDFYWGTAAHGKFYFVIADSTGHGVPGAFMSLLNISFLNEAINEKQIRSTGAILDHVRLRLIKNLEGESNSEGGKDGMDCCLICYDPKSNSIEFSCANNTLMLIRNGQIIDQHYDRMPVGRSPHQDQAFTTSVLSLQKNDIIYCYTDGFADQFGGEKGKKFMRKKLDALLLNAHNKSFNEQQQLLLNTFNSWKGDLDQVDDVLVFGMKI